jgi:beta-glucosidase
MMMKKVLLIVIVTVSVPFMRLSAKEKTSSPQIEQRIDELLSQMTLDEKIGQLNQLNYATVDANISSLVEKGMVGFLFNELDPKAINELQRIAVEKGRLHIPLIFARDIIHGFKTIFPIPLGQAATWNTDIVRRASRIAALEASSIGIRCTFAPMMDVSRDPRWGRIAESCGEDTYLTTAISSASVSGFQTSDLSNANSLAACGKHFAGYGFTESGKDYNTTHLTERELRDVVLPPFKAAADSGCAMFMCAFSDIDGVPSTGNRHLLTDILRGEWHYQGVLDSDWESIRQMMPWGYCGNLYDACVKAMNAGVDMDMESWAYFGNLSKALQRGDVKESSIDDAVRRVLRLKFRMGLFDHPYAKISKSSQYYKPEYLQAARNAAVESAVLLKNDGILPLRCVKRVAVVGPLADSKIDQVGTWCFDAEPEHCITPLQAIRDYCGKQTEVVYEPGLTFSRDTSVAGINRAVARVADADVILFFAGEEAVLSGEARCRADISLPGAQTGMLMALRKTGRPVVTVVMAGRPLTLSQVNDNTNALLFMFHGGTMAGPALSDLIFGNAVPSGKLPISFPRMSGQIPVYYNHPNTGRPAAGNITLINDIPVGAKQTSLGFTSYFLDAGDGPLFPFGYGKSYTTFDYGDVTLSKPVLSAGDSLMVSCAVSNTGSFDAKETVQLYVQDKVASVVRPVKELKGFQKIYLKKGETKVVTFKIKPSDLAFTHSDNRFYAEPGDFNVWIADDSQSGKAAAFALK